MYKLYLLTLTFLCSFLYMVPARSQKVETIKGTYKFNVDERSTMTFEQARNKAIENARMEGLKEKFGSQITSDIVVDMLDSSNGKAQSTLRERVQEVAKGEWLGDLHQPKVDILYDNPTHTFIYNVSIEGKGRELVGNKIPLDWHVLCGGTQKQFENDNFASGARIYVDFQAPTSGYLAIYLLQECDSAYCLLPYRQSENGIFKVKAGQHYVFFDRDSDPKADRYFLSTDQEVENNVVYLIFSPNLFTKCNDTQVSDYRPNAVSIEQFEKWRMACMQNDHQMVTDRKWVRIRK